MIIEIIGWILWCVLLFYSFTGVFFLRRQFFTGIGINEITLTQVFLCWVGVAIFLYPGFNKLHLLWVAPILFFSAYILLPIPIIGNIVGFIVSIFGRIITIGVR